VAFAGRGQRAVRVATDPGQTRPWARVRDGQDLAEYGMALAVIAVTSASAALAIAADVRVLFVRALQTIIVTVISF
jgi:dTDP-4-amino-4,6-dideoxygalactose transaminase